MLKFLVLLTSEPASRMFGLDMDVITRAIIVMISMFVLFILLGYLLFEPVKNVLHNRQKKITDDLEEAEFNQLQARGLKDEYETKLADIQREADKILSDARKKAVAREDKILQDAREEAEKIIERARAEIRGEKAQVKDDMRREIIEVATLLASKFIQTNMTEDKQKAMIQETMDEMGDSAWLD